MNTIAKAKISGHEATGVVHLIENESSYTLKFSNLDVAQGAPDVHIAHSKNEDGQLDESIIDIYEVKGNPGTLAIVVQKPFNFKDYTTIMIYCREYQAPFGFGVLEFINSN